MRAEQPKCLEDVLVSLMKDGTIPHGYDGIQWIYAYLEECEVWRKTLATTEQAPKAFQDELESLINRHSMENGSQTPDFILAEYLFGCLQVFDTAVAARSKWFGYCEVDNHVCDEHVYEWIPGGGSPSDPVEPERVCKHCGAQEPDEAAND